MPASDGITVAEVFALSGGQLRSTTRHIVHHHPQRALREVALWRELLAEHGSVLAGTR